MHDDPRHRRRRLHRQPHRAPARRARRDASSCSTISPPAFARRSCHGDAGGRQHRRSRARRPRCSREHHVDTVMHFAAHTIVPESVAESAEVLRQQHLRDAHPARVLRSEAGVKHFVFSSTAAVYGIPAGGVAAEDIADRADQPLRHVEADERVDAARPRRGDAHCATWCCATSTSPARDPGGRIGQSTRNGTLLIKVACEAAVGKRPHVSIFGTDYPTPDGTGVRDYIHVEDLADAHLQCARLPARRGGRIGDAQLRLRPWLQRARGARDGRAGARRVRSDPRRAAPRRRSAVAGRPGGARAPGPRLVAALDDLDTIVRTPLEWERRLQREPVLQKN